MMKPGPQDIELWVNGEMVGRGFAALANLPDTPAQREACARMFRVEARAVEAQERCDNAIAARDAALDEQRLAEEVVNTARASLISQLCARTDDLGRRLDALERKRARNYLDALPDPDNPDQDHPTHSPGGELHSVGPAEPRDPSYFDPDDSADAHDQIPEPKDPNGISLQMKDQTLPQYSPR
jgi:hypothetical protein